MGEIIRIESAKGHRLLRRIIRSGRGGMISAPSGFSERVRERLKLATEGKKPEKSEKPQE